jgi:lipid II:glycine glycyltransferase (peptidoglycan interpeptide bridge formation enzyme)
MATIFQTKEWENFKLSTGYQKSWRVFDVLVLEKKIPLLGSMLYTPVTSRDQTKLATEKIFLDQIRKIAQESKAIFYRLESGEEATTDISLSSSGYIKAFEEMQPEHTLLIDLTRSEDDILAQMKQKGRYNIKIAEKHQVEVATGEVSDFYKLYAEMAKRQKITFRDISYFQNLVDKLGKKEYARVFNVKAPDGTLLASAIIVFFGGICTYLFGGSTSEHREMMGPYKLHWEVMKEAKRRGCKYYDMFGIAPNEDEKHPWAGVTRFKRQFGGQDFSSLGSWDLVISPIKYKLFKLAEKIRR